MSKNVAQPKKKSRTCRLCAAVPEGGYFIDMIKEERQTDAIPPEIVEMIGDTIKLNSGYKAWVVRCPHCKTRYLAEVDVEPFVWDFSLEREHEDGTARTQFGDVFTFPKQVKKSRAKKLVKRKK